MVDKNPKLIVLYTGEGWEGNLYYIDPQPKKKPKLIIDDIYGFVYYPMCRENGLDLYYRSSL
jgi:hypothetical protein